jgi:polyferredoxin
MQLEGFFYFLFLGVFQAAVIHYSIAKIAGPLVFGRGWCGYACWTAMVLDFLPYKVPEKPRVVKLEKIRYLMFVLSLSLVAALFLFKPDNLEMIMFISFIAGNLIYYAVGIWLAYRFKDNRAFCKYFCPITVFLKPACYFSITRIKVDEAKCIHCGKCLKVCPMNVDMLNNSRRRKNGTECILCMACIKVCPKSALKM